MTRTIFTSKLLFIAALLFFGVSDAFAQNRMPPPKNVDHVRPDRPRPNLGRILGLSQEQVAAMRKLNAENKAVEMEARKKFQEAGRELNRAIYADTVDEEAVKARLADYQAAQAELARIKFTSELAVRKILTPEQLVKFRDIRREFNEKREYHEKRPPMPPQKDIPYKEVQ